jgi:hypothetical protein
LSYSEHPVRHVAGLVVSWLVAIGVWGGSLYAAILLGQHDTDDGGGGSMLFIVPVCIVLGGLVAYAIGRFVFHLIARPDQVLFDEIDEHAVPLETSASRKDDAD